MRLHARAALLAAAFCLGSTTAAAAEASVGVKLRLTGSLVRDEEERWRLLTLGTARVAASASSETVKAELAVSALLADGIAATLARASVAARFPAFRVTLGKARLAWGEGAAFNAADLLFGGTSVTGIDLGADALRDDAAWLAAVTVPLGRFSFAEAVILPPATSLAALASPSAPLPDPAGISAGGRVVGKIAGIKTEAAYLYRGSGRVHELAASLQGNLFLDWHLSARLGLREPAPPAPEPEDLRLSAGLFHLQRLGRQASLSMRLEALASPLGAWTEVEPAADPAPVYGVILYPELALELLKAVTVSARALISPVDGSSLLVPAVTLSVHKGLAFLAMGAVAFGDETDVFSPARRGGIAASLGCSFVY